MYQAKQPVRTKAELESHLKPMHPSQVNKIIDHIDSHCRAWLERTTFVTIASCNAQGQMDVSPKGDPPGFIKVLDPNTLAIPDRIGNYRADTFQNILENPNVGMLCVVPKRKEVVRINGTAQIVTDDDLRDLTTLNGHRPDLILLIHVKEAFFHCGKSMIRSRMWQPEEWGSIEGLPSYSEALKDHGDTDMSLEDIEARMAHNEANRLY